MAKELKQLAGETAIYGLSTILARIVNFLLVPLYTRVLPESDYGVVTEFMAYIAILQVILCLGLETGCFRFASREGADTGKVFANAFYTVASLCGAFLAIVSIFSGQIADALGYSGFGYITVFVALILLIDCSTSILFAKLRYEHKALKFAVIKTIKILTEVGVNLYLYLNCANPDFTYAITAILVSCAVSLLLLLGDLSKLRPCFDKGLWKQLLIYSLPLMIAGLPGVLNDFIDRVLMRFINADPALWRADLGIYQAGIKIAVIMQLFIQMFRYAAEPFFFQRSSQKGSVQLYARVMNWFVAFCMFAFLCIMLYIDEIGLILGRSFREGLAITPIMLMAYIFLGMLFNVNMWYKLSGKTGYAIWITLSGLVVTLIINGVWMPRYSYHAAAWAHLASYAAMLLASVLLGNRYYRIPYNWGIIVSTIALGVGFYLLSGMLPTMPMWLEHTVNAGIIAIFAVAAGGALMIKEKHTSNES